MSGQCVSEFEYYGLAGEQLAVEGGRPWLLTVDFEAFRPDSVRWWAPAMRFWAHCARQAGLRFSFFLSVEDVVRLKLDPERRSFEEFADACRSLEATGTRFYPHNHCLFDAETGYRPGEASGFPGRIEGYPRFPSMVYDVVHRNGATIASWLPTVVEEYERFLGHSGLRRPDLLAFRAGGWDYGVSEGDMRDFLEGVERAGIAFESSALRADPTGVPGVSTLPFGRNVFRLRKDVVEVAPTDHVRCGLLPSIGLWSTSLIREHVVRRSVGRPGALVTVIHFDHVFHAGHGRGTRYFVVTDERTVRERIVRFFRSLTAVRRLLRLENVTFDDLPHYLPRLHAGAEDRNRVSRIVPP